LSPEKDIHFGLGLSATHVGSCDRRDRLLLLAAIAHALLTLLGAAGEKVGLDREFQTSPKRVRPRQDTGRCERARPRAARRAGDRRRYSFRPRKYG
jgi:hypothetical protein